MQLPAQAIVRPSYQTLIGPISMKIYAQGLVKAVGVSNYGPQQLQRIHRWAPQLLPPWLQPRGSRCPDTSNSTGGYGLLHAPNSINTTQCQNACAACHMLVGPTLHVRRDYLQNIHAENAYISSIVAGTWKSGACRWRRRRCSSRC